jgi:hypothetical protein
MRRGCRVGLAAGGALLAAALLPATAAAVVPVITNDAGAPTPVTPGLVIRNMNVEIGFGLSGAEGRIKAQVTGPDGGQVMSPANCTTFVGARGVDYRGNGPYTVAVQTFAANDFNCATPIGAFVGAYIVNAFVATAPPGGRQLNRAPGAFGLRTIDVPIALNPGAVDHEVRYARAGRIGPDGAIAGASKEGFYDRARSVVPLRLDRPGRWVIVARARGFTTSTGPFYTPWSDPRYIQAVAPFDLRSLSFPDSRGPSYQLEGRLGEATARGVVRISVAPGRRGGTFRALGPAKVGKNATFRKRFSVAAPGVYRLRITRKKTATMAGGVITRPITISRRFF